MNSGTNHTISSGNQSPPLVELTDFFAGSYRNLSFSDYQRRHESVFATVTEAPPKPAPKPKKAVKAKDEVVILEEYTTPMPPMNTRDSRALPSPSTRGSGAVSRDNPYGSPSGSQVSLSTPAMSISNNTPSSPPAVAPGAVDSPSKRDVLELLSGFFLFKTKRSFHGVIHVLLLLWVFGSLVSQQSGGLVFSILGFSISMLVSTVKFKKWNTKSPQEQTEWLRQRALAKKKQQAESTKQLNQQLKKMGKPKKRRKKSPW